MICIVSGTNRPDSSTSAVTRYIYNYLVGYQEEVVELISLEDIPGDVLNNSMYEEKGQSEYISNIQDNILIPSNLWIIVTPEYNGSYAGVFKVFIDALSVRKYDETFAGKHVALIGISSGRAGNLRGMEHLTGVLNYLKMHVFPDKLPISSIQDIIDENGELDAWTKKSIHELINEFLFFAPQKITQRST